MNPHESPSITVLGIDPGSLCTGYAFLKQTGSRIHVLEYGAIRCRPRAELSERLFHIIEELESKIQRHRPEHIGIESAFVAKNVHSALVLGHVRGALMVLGHRYKMQLFEISPRKVKQSLTGNGAASKEQVAHFVQHHLGLAHLEGPLDATDALAIAWCTFNSTRLIPPAISAPISKKSALTTALPPPGTNRVATALPAHIDPRAFLLAHGQKKRKRR